MGNVEMCAQLAGLFTTYVVLNLTDGNGQPALLYIVPFTLGMFSSNGFRRRIHIFGVFLMLIEDAKIHHFDVQVSSVLMKAARYSACSQSLMRGTVEQAQWFCWAGGGRS